MTNQLTLNPTMVKKSPNLNGGDEWGGSWPECLPDEQLAIVGTGSPEQHVYSFLEKLSRLDSRWKFSTGNSLMFKRSSRYKAERKVLVDELLKKIREST